MVRSRVKRTLREAFRACAADLPPSNDFVIVARPSLATLAEERGTAGVEEALRSVLETTIRGGKGGDAS